LHPCIVIPSVAKRGAAVHYISNQAEHHRVKPFREELIEMLRLAEIEFDEKYLD
jgi:hypothetical protein